MLLQTFYNIVFFAIITIPIISLSATERNVAQLPNCAENNSHQGWVLINTLDGKLTVLDSNNNGKEMWNIQTEPGSMLSSNIDRLELTNNGHWVRIIPSLTGSLYKFNGDTIDAIPITADSLLTASFRYLDDLVIAGGKEVRTYGVIFNTGQLLYECSIKGCQNQTDVDNYDDLLLVERNTQTVRAIEPRSGLERWNFSVSQIDLKYSKSNCLTVTAAANANHHIHINAVVPEGLIYAFDDATKQIVWKKRFSTPIVNVWTWNGYLFQTVDLFTDNQYAWSRNANHLSPALYIGMHNKQLYIHESNTLQQYLTSNKERDRSELLEIKSISQIPWKPFPAKSSSLAIIDDDVQNNIIDSQTPNHIATTALSVLYGSEYVNGNGFYLYTSDDIDKQNHIQCENNLSKSGDDDISDSNNNNNHHHHGVVSLYTLRVIFISLWLWWKEILAITLTTIFVLNLFLSRNEEKCSGNDCTPSTSQFASEIPLYIKNNSNSEDCKEFASPFLLDFIPLHCLGKGGFGVVFEAKKKFDECNYAVKRITLPNKQESREKVMREVKALATLDHHNIVRYFNAWIEVPPPKWISDFDQKWMRDKQNLATFTTTTMSTTSSVYNKSMKQEKSIIIDFTDSKATSTTDSYIVFEKTNVASRQEENVDCSEASNDITNSNSNSNTTNNRLQQLANGKVYLYIQMQLCRRDSLRDWLRNNVKRNRNDIKLIFQQIISAVEYVHQKGLIHRDLKPSNIFFSIEDHVKIGDFGLVTTTTTTNWNTNGLVQRQRQADDTTDAEKHTQAVGTQLYMSPEQLNGLNYNYKVDIYSLGVILFELLVPFCTDMERVKTLTNLRHNIYPDKFSEDLPEEHKLLVLMLANCPDDRPSTKDILTRSPFIDDDSNSLII